MADAGRAMAADPAFKGALLEPPAFLGVAGVGDTGVRVLVRVRIRAADRLAVEGEFRRRLIDAFLARGLAPSLGRGIRIAEATAAHEERVAPSPNAAGPPPGPSA